MEITDGCSVVHIIQDLLFCDDFHWILESNILITNTVVDLLGLGGKENRDNSFWWLCEFTKSFKLSNEWGKKDIKCNCFFAKNLTNSIMLDSIYHITNTKTTLK